MDLIVNFYLILILGFNSNLGVIDELFTVFRVLGQLQVRMLLYY